MEHQVINYHARVEELVGYRTSAIDTGERLDHLVRLDLMLGKFDQGPCQLAKEKLHCSNKTCH
jgi:hypothetical protein